MRNSTQVTSLFRLVVVDDAPEHVLAPYLDVRH